MNTYTKPCDLHVIFVEGEDDVNGWLGVERGWYWGRAEPLEDELLFVGSTEGPYETRELADEAMHEELGRLFPKAPN